MVKKRLPIPLLALSTCLAFVVACATASPPAGVTETAGRHLSVTGFGSDASVNGASVAVFQERLKASLSKSGMDVAVVEERAGKDGEGWLLRGRIVDLPVIGATSGLGRVVVHAELLRGGQLVLAKTYEEGVYYGADGQGTLYSGDQPQKRAMELVVRAIVKDVRRVMGRD